MFQSFDVALVGNGIIAYAIAFELKRRDPAVRVVIIGPSNRLGAGSAAAGAMLGCFAEVTHNSFQSFAGRAKFDLCRRSSELWDSWLRELNEMRTRVQPVRLVKGTVVIENAVSDTLDSDNFDAIIGALDATDESYEAISPRDIEGLNPVPTARPIRAVYLPEENAVDTGKTHRLLHSVLERQGVKFVNQCCVKLSMSGSVVSGIHLASGDRIHAAAVVCAAGAYSTRILDTVLDQTQVQPVFSGVGIAFVTNRPANRSVTLPHTVRSVNRGGSCGLHVIPLDSDCDYIGATNAIIARPTLQATAGLSHFLLQCAIDQLDQWYAHAVIDHWRIGNRPVALDTFPLLGFSGVDGLYIATGTYRDGFQSSPMIARIVADEINNGRSCYNHPFQPTRQPISVFSPAESIAECSRHAMCTGFEASLVLPRLWPDATLRASFSAPFQQIYDKLKVTNGLSPDMLPFLSVCAAGNESERMTFARVVNLLEAKGMSNMA